MEDKEFLHACELINTSLVHLEMDRTFNSIGSNVFFQFGKEKKVEVRKGRKIIEKEWSLWISDASWRISKNGKYIVGSGDSPQIIQSNIQRLLGKRFQSFQFLSQFLDVAFNFEDSYEIITFFNWAEDNQWSLLLPDDSSIGIDCSNKEAIKNVQSIAKNFPIIETYKKLNDLLQGAFVTKINSNKYNLPVFHFENDISFNLEACAWRLEKNKEYIIGCLDNDKGKIKNELSKLISKKLKRFNIANSMMDARLQFENGYVLKTFTCCRIVNQWKIFSQNKPVFSASISIFDQE